jgi:serine/threonine protein kinase
MHATGGGGTGSSSAAAAASSSGSRELVVGRKYRLGTKIGSGAFGMIYDGVCLTTDQRIAIKLVGARRMR